MPFDWDFRYRHAVDDQNNYRHVQYTIYPSTTRGSSLAVNDCTVDVRVKSDRPSTP